MTNETQSDQFPTIVYKGKGPYSRAGGTYDYASANDQDELDAKLNEGWFATLPVAIDANDNPQPVSADDAPPTRSELEAKAAELGIKFDGRTTDKKLGQLIQDKLSTPAGE